MGKSTHFIGQPLLRQIINFLNKDKVLRLSLKHGGERYVKRFDGWQHLVVMLYAVIMRFDSLREIVIASLAEARKLAHLGVTTMPRRSTLSDAKPAVPSPSLRPYIVICMPPTARNFCRTAEAVEGSNGWKNSKS